MKAVRVHEYHQPAILDDVPEPTVTGAWDVVVEVGGAGLCRTDLHILDGQWAERSGVKLPYTIGHENAGWVREVGPSVTNVSIGDPVICHPLATCGLCGPCRAGEDAHCDDGQFPGISCDGGMAEYLLTNARSVARLNEELEPADVAALADAGLTAYHAVRKALPLMPPGSHVVCIGAGGLGHIGLQCLVALTAAEITVVDTSEDALRLAADLGANHVILGDGEQVEAVRDTTHGGAAVVIDFVGENGAELDGPTMLRRSGSYFAVGYGGLLQVPTMDLIANEINIIGNLVGTYGDLVELMHLVSARRVRLHTQRYRLSDFSLAIEDLQMGEVRGRAILVPDKLARN